MVYFPYSFSFLSLFFHSKTRKFSLIRWISSSRSCFISELRRWRTGRLFRKAVLLPGQTAQRVLRENGLRILNDSLVQFQPGLDSFSRLSIQIILGNYILVPVEAIFRIALHIFQICFCAVDIDKTISFFIALMRADQVNKRPRTVSNQLYSILNRKSSLLEVALQIIDPVIIMDGAIFLWTTRSLNGRASKEKQKLVPWKPL